MFLFQQVVLVNHNNFTRIYIRNQKFLIGDDAFKEFFIGYFWQNAFDIVFAGEDIDAAGVPGHGFSCNRTIWHGKALNPPERALHCG